MRWGLTACVGVATSLSSNTFGKHLTSLQTGWDDQTAAAAAYLKSSTRKEGVPSIMVPNDCWSFGEKPRKQAPEFVQDLLVYNDDFCAPCRSGYTGPCHSGVQFETVYWPPKLQMVLVRGDQQQLFSEGNPAKRDKNQKVTNARPLDRKFDLGSISRVKGVLRVGPRSREASTSSMFVASDPDTDGSKNMVHWDHYIEECVHVPQQTKNRFATVTEYQTRDRCGQGATVLDHNKDVLEWATALMFSPNPLTDKCKIGANRCDGSLLYAHMWLSKSEKSGNPYVNFRMERDLGYTAQPSQHPEWQCHRQQVSWLLLDSPSYLSTDLAADRLKAISSWVYKLIKTSKITACSYNYLWSNLVSPRNKVQLEIMAKAGVEAHRD